MMQAMEPSVVGVCVAGVSGVTGRAVARAIAEADDLHLVGGVSRSSAGRPLRELAGDDAADVAVAADVATALAAGDVDVLVDYTSADVVRAHVDAAVARGVAVVVGSSGLATADFEEIDTAATAAGVAVIASGNFSVLAALLKRCGTFAAGHVERWEVIDYASAGKLDAPSGTSSELADALGSVRRPTVDRPLDEIRGQVEARGATVSGGQVHSIRLPSFYVSTEVVFAAPGERLSIRHDAGESAEPYVAGTLLAVRAAGTRTGVTRGLDRLLFDAG